jgi:hypothetical protein
VQAVPTPFPVQVSYALPTRSSVTATVVGADGTAVGEGVYVSIYPFGASGPYGYSYVYAYTDVDGKAVFDNLPSGPARVEVERYNEILGISELAVESLVLMPGQNTEVTLRVGTATYTEYDLTGDDGFTYTIDSDGEIDDSNSGVFSSIFSANMYFDVDDDSACCQYIAKLTQGGREIQFGPSFSGSSVITNRRIYSPQEGGFVRYYDTFTNILPYERVVEVIYYHRFTRTSQFAYVEDVVKGAFTAVPLEAGVPDVTTAIAGIVTHGAGSTLTAAVDPEYPIPGSDSSRTDYAYRLRLPANGTVALLHFVAQRGPLDLAPLQTQLGALQDLTDSRALFGLTAGEKALIKNFIVP